MYPEDKHTGLSGVEGSATKYIIHGITLSPVLLPWPMSQ